MLLLGLTMTVIALAGFFSNLLLIYMLGRRPKTRKRHVFTLNLAFMGALSSLIYGLACYYLFYGKDLIHNACEIEAFAISVLAIGAIMQLTVISAERCAIVWRPFLEKSILLSQKCAVVGLVYLVSIALSSPPLYGWSRFSKVNEQFFCTFDYTQRDIGTRSYLFFVLVAGYLMPIAVISFSYIIIYTIVRRSDFSNLRSTNTESTTSSQLPTEGSYSIEAVLLRTRSLSTVTQKRRNEQRRQVRIAILTLVVCGTFLLCWTPFAILYVIWPLFSETLPSTTLTTIATICGKSFVIINPIIYGFNAKSWQVPAVRLSLYCGCKSNAKIRSQFCTDEGLLRKSPAGNVIQREISNE